MVTISESLEWKVIGKKYIRDRMIGAKKSSILKEVSLLKACIKPSRAYLAFLNREYLGLLFM
jgi:hypothetical protein